MSNWHRTPAVVIVVLVVQIAGVLLFISRYDFNISSLMYLGKLESAYTPELLGPDVVVYIDTGGYDGQYFYYIARDPFLRSPHHLTNAYRYGRVGYPLLVWLTSLGSARLLPYTLVLVNLASVALGTAAVVGLLRDWSLSPWLALLYGLNPGHILSIQMDLPDAMAVDFGVLGLYFWKRERRVLAVVAFALAVLARETAALFLIPAALFSLRERCPRQVAIPGLALVPWAMWQLYILAKLGQIPLIAGSGNKFDLPFVGMAQTILNIQWQCSLPDLIRQTIVLPIMVLAIAALLLASFKLSKRYDMFNAALLLHALLAIYTDIDSWNRFSSAGRVFIGLFPLSLLGYGAYRDFVSKVLLAGVAALSLFTFLRPVIITPVLPYVLSP
nr:hypothetical protein [Anaerolineae bacterium]